MGEQEGIWLKERNQTKDNTCWTVSCVYVWIVYNLDTWKWSVKVFGGGTGEAMWWADGRECKLHTCNHRDSNKNILRRQCACAVSVVKQWTPEMIKYWSRVPTIGGVCTRKRFPTVITISQTTLQDSRVDNEDVRGRPLTRTAWSCTPLVLCLNLTLLSGPWRWTQEIIELLWSHCHCGHTE